MIEFEKFTNPLRNRLKSPVLWTAIISLLLYVLKKYYALQFEEYDVIIDMLLNVLIALGIINNPSIKEKL
jgi:uncharacterized membrane protein